MSVQGLHQHIDICKMEASQYLQTATRSVPETLTPVVACQNFQTDILQKGVTPICPVMRFSVTVIETVFRAALEQRQGRQ